MVKQFLCAVVAITVLASCGDDPFRRGATGAGFGAGTALLMAGNPLLGAAVGAGLGAVTTRDNVDLGNAPI